ncbi:hypothetical protein SeLEV6574_g08062 [Synchytrium endobioticum]|uniref:Uncharacterized protein n=1 Tax=Synchytrium endobioticum TaxID=286115 RepID=A0A507CAN2_9FUNG|nr:hypothetical protein SeLEV6574_g08062 [Synchytrium endobioticum]
MIERYLLQLWCSFGRVMHQSGKMKISIIGYLMLSASLFLSLVAGLPAGNQGDNVQNAEIERKLIIYNAKLEQVVQWMNKRCNGLEKPETDVIPVFASNHICIEDWKKQLRLARSLVDKIWSDREKGVDSEEAAVMLGFSFMDYFKNIKGYPTPYVWRVIMEKGLVTEYAPLAVGHCRLMLKVLVYWEKKLNILLPDDGTKKQFKKRIKLRKNLHEGMAKLFQDLTNPKHESMHEEKIEGICSLLDEFMKQDSELCASIQNPETEQWASVEAVPNRVDHDRFSSVLCFDGYGDSTPSTSTSGHLGTSHGPPSSTSRASRRSDGRRSGARSRRVSE